MNKWTEILTGLILVIGMIVLSWYSSVSSWTLLGKNMDFLNAGWIFLKGGIFWMIIMIGLILILLGISDLKE